MRLLITGYHFPDLPTFKRLVLVADEIGFLDRPSVTFQNWGTIGCGSDIRRFKVDDSPITISVHEPPSGPAEGLYLPYIAADLQNPRFLHAVFEGLKDDAFACKFIQPMGKHGSERTLGTELRQDLLSDPSLPTQNLDADDIKDVFVGKCGTVEHRRALFKMTAVEASIALTSSLAITEETGLAPVSDDPHMNRLLALRTSDGAYVADAPRASGPLGIAVATALLPDEAIKQLSIGDLFGYRHETKDAYAAWSTEIDRLATRISGIEPEAIARELPGIIHGEFRPRMLEYRNAMKAARDKMFGELIKKVAKWEVPSLSLAYVAGLSFSRAIAVFASALAPAVPAVVDYFLARRDLKRTNAAAYLVGLTDQTEDG